MSISETCSCGASFSAERNDELKLLNAWRTAHKCNFPKSGDLAIVDSSNSSIAEDFRIPELHIGFRPSEDDDDDE
jgi:hypothetical protein